MPNEWQDFAESHRVGDIARRPGGQRHRLRPVHRHLQRPRGSRARQRDRGAGGGKLEDHYQVGDWVRSPHPAHRGGRQEGRSVDARRRRSRATEEIAELRGSAAEAAPSCHRSEHEESRARTTGYGGGARDAVDRPAGLRMAARRSLERGGRCRAPTERRDDQGGAGRGGRPHDAAHQEACGDHRQYGLRQYRRLASRTGEKIELRGFGSFRIRHRGARTGRNPKTGDKVSVPPKRIPYFKPGKELQGAAQRRVLSQARGWRNGLFTPWTPYRRLHLHAQEARLGHRQVDTDTGLFLLCRGPGSLERSGAAWWSMAASHHLVMLNLHPYSNGHLMVAPLAHHSSPQDCGAGGAGRDLAVGATLPAGARRAPCAARLQPWDEPRPGGRCRGARALPLPPGAALGRGHEFHDCPGGGPSRPRGPAPDRASACVRSSPRRRNRLGRTR